MKLYRLFLATWAVLFLFGCSTEKQETPEEVQAFAPHTFQTETHLSSADDCSVESEDCAFFRVSYPVFEGKYADVLNAFVDSIKSPAFNPDKINEPLDVQANEFLASYAAYRQEYTDDVMPWYLDYNVEVLSENETDVVFECEVSEYGGGAHANYAIMYHNFRKDTGKRIYLEDLFSAGEIAKLSIILSAGIDPTVVTFSETIYPNQNFIFTSDSITFFYNPYEIAPFSEGVIRMRLPRDQKLAM